jgi:predicted nucleic acid-binding protein
MAVQALVLIDTCIWVPFFNRPQSAEKRAVDELLDDDRAALVGPIVTEVLLGFRRDAQADWVASLLRGLHFFAPSWDEWRMAGSLGRQLAARGHALPLTDLVISAVALQRDVALYSSDPHFDLIADLQRFTP